VPALRSDRCDRNEALVIPWIIDFDCWRLGHDKGKRSAQSRTAATAEEHGQLPVVEIAITAPKITRWSAAPRSHLYLSEIAVRCRG